MLPNSINLTLSQLASVVNQLDPVTVLPAEGNQVAAASAVERVKQEGWFYPRSLTPSETAPSSLPFPAHLHFLPLSSNWLQGERRPPLFLLLFSSF